MALTTTRRAESKARPVSCRAFSQATAVRR